MKRKIKLLVSIASLTLSMALVMFGVYAAATTRQAQITGTISFRTENVRATVAVYEYTGTAPAQLGTDQLVGGQEFDPSEQDGLDVTLGTKVGGEDGEIPMSETVTTYTIVVRIKNDNSAGTLTVQVSPPSVTGQEGLSMTPTAGTSPIAAGATQEWKYVFSIDPAEVTSSTFTKAITATFTLSNT